MSATGSFSGTRIRAVAPCAWAAVISATAEAISRAFHTHRTERASLAPERGRKSERTELRALLTALTKSDEEYREAEEADDDRKRKRELRQHRNTLVQKLDMMLAQLGEVDLVNELKRIPVDRKIKRIDRYLKQPAPT